MISDEFEWDDEKAASNFAKHGVTFEDATFVFDDEDALDWDDDHADEERYCRLGTFNHVVYVVVYTYRNQRIRIISARTATPAERRAYHE